MLADAEAFDHIDSGAILASYDLVIDLLDTLTKRLVAFVEMNADVSDRRSLEKSKIQIQYSMLHLIQSILHWGVYSTPSIAFAAFVYRSIPDRVNEIWYFSSDIDRNYGLLWGDKINEKSGYFESKPSQVFFSKNKFVSGVAMRPHTLNQQWLHFLTMMIWLKTCIIDTTVRMDERKLSAINLYLSRWHALLKFIRNQLDTSVNRMATWRHQLASKRK